MKHENIFIGLFGFCMLNVIGKTLKINYLLCKHCHNIICPLYLFFITKSLIKYFLLNLYDYYIIKYLCEYIVIARCINNNLIVQ